MKTLIFSPHLDDEVISCASFLDNSQGLSIFYSNTQHCFVSDNTVMEENRKLKNALGCDMYYSKYRLNINKLDTIPIADLINEMETIINLIKPQMVVLPFPSYNQDHRMVHDAALTALRFHDKNFFVDKVLLFEGMDVLGTMRSGEKFNPNYFKVLDMDKKRTLNKFYQSQIRGHRDFDDMEAIAKVRGAQSGCEYAEAFEIVRWVE